MRRDDTASSTSQRLARTAGVRAAKKERARLVAPSVADKRPAAVLQAERTTRRVAPSSILSTS